MSVEIASSIETGRLQLPHLKRIWSSTMAQRQGQQLDRKHEYYQDCAVLSAIGMGLHQVLQYLFSQAPGFAEFEDWVESISGLPDPLSVQRLQAAFGAQQTPDDVKQWLQDVEDMPDVLDDNDLMQWQEEGYVVLRHAVPIDACERAEHVIWQHLQARCEDRESWYTEQDRNGIMIELIQHEAFHANRQSLRIHKAFAQLWGTADLWVSADRCGFHPPQRPGYPFPGPDLHWDVDFSLPLSFSTQGILYLTDTLPEQGALTVVPGFHKKLSQWLEQLPDGADPQKQDLHALGSRPVPGNAGDMVIWHHQLPHGSRPNLEQLPRMVQYINMLPASASLE